MNAKTEVEQQLENWKQAVLSQNLEKIMTYYAEDVRAFDAIAELQFTNRSKYQTHWQHCLQMCSMTKFEIGQIDIKVDGDLAVCFFLNQCGGIDEKTGEEQVGWVRGTQVYQKNAGKWLIVHEHFSLPFDMTTGTAMFHLTPETSW
ncbi:YybH family protein [Methylophaga muralis]|uniref:Calcium/calmodulin dependent protein kinase II Association n=1 Tax=Methylophaga muralis TaxID=291169 RepID=A0A1E3GSW7_9GAMM|nr:nuclear transport factor 2 family protein [Methylophaga muralis]ODN67104.1 Calcium/calmodulin dependent protein kinase II Association [Methylophaga muralis]